MGEYDFLHFPAEAVSVDPAMLASLAPSAQKVFAAIRQRGALTQREIHEETGLPPRTVRFALRRLREEGLLDSRCSLRDCRTSFFFVDRAWIRADALEEVRDRAQKAQARGEKFIEAI